MIMTISNEGWDAICFSVLFVCVTIVVLAYILKTGKWPWE